MNVDADSEPQPAVAPPAAADEGPAPVKHGSRQIFQRLERSVPYAALLLSVISLGFTWAVSAQSTESQSVNEQYQVFIDLAEMGIQNPENVHLLTLPESYHRVSCDVARHMALLSPEEQAAYPLKERAVADYIFTLFERSVYQQRVTSGWWGKMFPHSRRVNNEVVAYFTGRLLRNPRLLWYWRADGGGLRRHYEDETIERYEAGVLRGLGASRTSSADAKLPSCDHP
jgi:hypothetical protein